MMIETRDEGIDLTQSADRQWLTGLCQGGEVDLLVIGPIYRMSKGSPAKGDAGGEDQARSITAAIDEVRHRAGVTVIIEAHAPHASQTGYRDLRPIGSSVWMRWPEFGLGLRPTPDGARDQFEFAHWRGDRDERSWPHALFRNSKPWPWLATLT